MNLEYGETQSEVKVNKESYQRTYRKTETACEWAILGYCFKRPEAHSRM